MDVDGSLFACATVVPTNPAPEDSGRFELALGVFGFGFGVCGSGTCSGSTVLGEIITSCSKAWEFWVRDGLGAVELKESWLNGTRSSLACSIECAPGVNAGGEIGAGSVFPGGIGSFGILGFFEADSALEIAGDEVDLLLLSFGEGSDSAGPGVFRTPGRFEADSALLVLGEFGADDEVDLLLHSFEVCSSSAGSFSPVFSSAATSA